MYEAYVITRERGILFRERITAVLGVEKSATLDLAGALERERYLGEARDVVVEVATSWRRGRGKL